MTATLAQLIPVPTLDQLMDRALRHLKGVGWTRHTVGFGVGAIDCDGVPAGDFDVVIRVISTGGIGVGEFQFSLDAGATFSVTLLIPAAGPGIYVMPGTGCTLTFDDDGETLLGFQANDEYRLFLRQNGFPITSWQPLSTPRTLVENDVEALQALFDIVQGLGLGGYLSTATGPWVDLQLQQNFNDARRLGLSTIGNVQVTDAQNQGPFNLAAGDLIIATGGGLQYTNTQAVVVALGAAAQVIQVQAVGTGVAYNAPNNTIVVRVSAQAGLTVNNPDPGSGTWVTRGGTDAETDAQAIARAQAKLPALGFGAPTPDYDTWAKAASDEVTKTTTSIDQTTAGRLNLYLAGSGGGVTVGAVAAVQAYVNPRAPQCVDVVVASAATLVVNIIGTIFVFKGFEAQARAAWEAALAELVASAPIGPATIYLDQIRKCFLDAPGVRNAFITGPILDVQLTAAQVIAITENTVTQAV